jgi:hypothetical protein
MFPELVIPAVTRCFHKRKGQLLPVDIRKAAVTALANRGSVTADVVLPLLSITFFPDATYKGTDVDPSYQETQFHVQLREANCLGDPALYPACHIRPWVLEALDSLVANSANAALELSRLMALDIAPPTPRRVVVDHDQDGDVTDPEDALPVPVKDPLIVSREVRILWAAAKLSQVLYKKMPYGYCVTISF